MTDKAKKLVTGNKDGVDSQPAAPVQTWFAEEGSQNGVVTLLRCQHHLPDDAKNTATDMSDEYIVLGGMTIWPCVNCSKRVRESVATSIMVEGARIMLRNEPEFTKELIERMRSEREEAHNDQAN